MELYQVSFYVKYPDSIENKDNASTAFVQAKDWNEAVRKVEKRYEKEFESATVFSVSLAENCEIII